MSGGKFDYQNRQINDWIETIEYYINKNGKRKTAEEIKYEDWRDPDWYVKYPEELYHRKYSNNIIEEFKTGVEILKKAYIYANRIDYLLCGDDEEESFISRLKEDLNKLK